MMCYKDTTYCKFYKDCDSGKGCPRALSEKVLDDANKWWGKDGVPISCFASKPECFMEIKNED